MRSKGSTEKMLVAMAADPERWFSRAELCKLRGGQLGAVSAVLYHLVKSGKVVRENHRYRVGSKPAAANGSSKVDRVLALAAQIEAAFLAANSAREQLRALLGEK